MRILTAAVLAMLPLAAVADPLPPREGWMSIDTDKTFGTLLEDLKSAVRSAGFGVVTEAGPTGAARARGVTIPDNRVVGVFNNVYAVRILNLSVPAMIEAPIRFYLTDDGDGTASLSWKTPGFVFAPYVDGADPDLAVAASELDAAFAGIAQTAAR